MNLFSVHVLNLIKEITCTGIHMIHTHLIKKSFKKPHLKFLTVGVSCLYLNHKISISEFM